MYDVYRFGYVYDLCAEMVLIVIVYGWYLLARRVGCLFMCLSMVVCVCLFLHLFDAAIERTCSSFIGT